MPAQSGNTVPASDADQAFLNIIMAKVTCMYMHQGSPPSQQLVSAAGRPCHDACREGACAAAVHALCGRQPRQIGQQQPQVPSGCLSGGAGRCVGVWAQEQLVASWTALQPSQAHPELCLSNGLHGPRVTHGPVRPLRVLRVLSQ